MSRKTLVLVYSFFFFMYFFGFNLLGNSNAGEPFQWEKHFEPLDFSFYFYTLLTVMLAHFVVFRKFYYAKPKWKLWLAILALLVFFILYRYLVEEILFPLWFGYSNYNPSTSFRFYAVDNIYFGGIRILFGFVLFLFDEVFRRQKREAELQQQNRAAELRFLQAQMNPHFLFNSLNNIYALAMDQHPQTAGAVLKLSDMMRFVTYEKETTIPLEKELDYIKNMISLQQLRLDYPLQHEIRVPEEVLQTKIPPLTLVPLVENGLKHGDLSDPQLPLTILVSGQAQQLVLKVMNKKGEAVIGQPGGLGLQNLRRRLELSYEPGTFQFDVNENENQFSVTLRLPVS